MSGQVPQFPTIEIWQQMDEGAQDALIDRIAAAQRRRVRLGRMLLGLACGAVIAIAVLAVYAMMSGTISL